MLKLWMSRVKTSNFMCFCTLASTLLFFKYLVFLQFVWLYLKFYYSNFDSSQWIKRIVQIIIAKNFREKNMLFNRFTLSYSNLLKNFVFLPVFVVVLTVIKLIVMNY